MVDCEVAAVAQSAGVGTTLDKINGLDVFRSSNDKD